MLMQNKFNVFYLKAFAANFVFLFYPDCVGGVRKEIIKRMSKLVPNQITSIKETIGR